MRRFSLLSLVFITISVGAWAQQGSDDLRTVETKIADLLMQLPAQNTSVFNNIMNELYQLDGQVITNFANELVPPGEGDDVQFRYAISGMAKYASQEGDFRKMKQCAEAICEAISMVRHDEIRDFLLQELQYVAGEESVPVAASLLFSQRLCDPAARVLIRINSEGSKKVLFEKLLELDRSQQLVIVKAIGTARYKPAHKILMDLAILAEGDLKKGVLHSLAQMGNPVSAKLLESEAKNVGFSYDPVEATASYLLFIRRASEESTTFNAQKASKKIIKNEDAPLPIKSHALRIMVDAAGAEAFSWLVKALKSSDKQYRMSAISLIGTIYSPGIAAVLQKKAMKNNNTVLQSELIYLFGQQKDKSTFPLVLQLLDYDDKQVQLASINAAARIGETEAIEPLIELMKTGDEEIILEIKTALLSIKGEEVANSAALFIPETPGNARAALIEIIEKRKAYHHKPLVFKETENEDPSVNYSAAKALSSLVNQGDEKKIAALLNSASDEKMIRALQDAMFVAVNDYMDELVIVGKVRELMQHSGDMKIRYYPVLARIGGPVGLKIVHNEFEDENIKQKEAAIQALCAWSDQTALHLLYQITRETSNHHYADMALNSYISGINRSENTTDQKVLMFRKAMELAGSTEQKSSILAGVSRNSTLLALAFVSRYLDVPDLQQTAVQAVHSIVLSNSSLYGLAVDSIVRKAIKLNRHPEADYQKEALLKQLNSSPSNEGFVSMFNNKNLEGWKGLVGNPISRATMAAEKQKAMQNEVNEKMTRDWKIKDGILVYEGSGFNNLCSEKMYDDFELILDWRIGPDGDGGIYLRGSPQVQIWDTSRVKVGAQVGSGGLYNNKIYESKPILVADNPVKEWNTFRIKMIDDKVTVFLNGKLVTDNVILENYWNREQAIFEKEYIELQAHASLVEYRDIFIREIPRVEPYKPDKAEQEEGFVPLFNGVDLSGWTGNLVDYFAQDGMIVCQPTGHGKGNLFTEKQYSNFILRFEFQLTPGANNGLGIRTPLTGDAAYAGMELQILDNGAEIYKNLKPYQYHGSVYGVIPAKRGFLNPVGEWNYQEVHAIGNQIKVNLNGETILDGNIAKASNNGALTIDNRDHPGLLNKSGYIGFLGHGSSLKFRNIRIKNMEN